MLSSSQYNQQSITHDNNDNYDDDDGDKQWCLDYFYT